MRTAVLSLAAVAVVAPSHAFVGSHGRLPLASTRTAAAVCTVSMSQEGNVGRRAALLTALTSGVALATKQADAAGLNLMPPGLGKKAAPKDDAAAAPAGSKFDGAMDKLKMPEIKAPSFEVPKFGSKKSEDSDTAPAPKPRRQTGFSLGKKAKKESKADDEPAVAAAAKPETPKDAPEKPRKVKQAGMSGKADERFTGGGVDSLEQKLLSKKLKSQEQLEEMKAKVGDKEVDIPTLNPFSSKD